MGTSGAKTISFSATGVSTNRDLYWHPERQRWPVASCGWRLRWDQYVPLCGWHAGCIAASHGFDCPEQLSDVHWGKRAGDAFGYLGYFFNGLVDEVSLYNRALSATEIQAIYAAGSAGKCPPSPMPPSITMQPTNQTVYVGGTATFSVTAAGTPPLSYQWNFDGTNIWSDQHLVDADQRAIDRGGQLFGPGDQPYGSIISSNAVLTVNPPPPCDPAPSGLVDWWPGEGNANDIVGTNNGTLGVAQVMPPAKWTRPFRSTDRVATFQSRIRLPWTHLQRTSPLSSGLRPAS